MKFFILFFLLFFSAFGFSQDVPNAYPYAIFQNNYSIEKNENGQFGVKNKKGETIVPFIYNRIVNHPTGLVVFKLNKSDGYERTYSCGFYTKGMNFVLPCNYSSLVPLADGTLIACHKSLNLFGLTDTIGRIIIPFKYAELCPPTDKLFCAKYDNKYGYIDQHDQTIIPFIFQFAKPFSEGLAIATTKKLVGFINKKGQFEIEEKFSGANDFSMGYAEVFINDEASIIDTKGEILFPFIFHSIRPIPNSYFIFEAPESYRNKLSQLLVETPIATNLDQRLPLLDSLKETDEFGGFYSNENSVAFQGVLTKNKLLIGGESLRKVDYLTTVNGLNYYSVQNMNQINASENWNFALMNNSGKLMSDFVFLSLSFDPKNNRIIGEIDAEKGVTLVEVLTNGKYRLLEVN